MNFRKLYVCIFLAVALTWASTSYGLDRRWINPAGGAFSEPTSWNPSGDPHGDDLRFLVGPLGDTYSIYLDHPAPGQTFRCRRMNIEDYVTLDLLGRNIEIDSHLFVGSGGGAIASARSLTLTNNVLQRAELLTQTMSISNLLICDRVDVRSTHDLDAIYPGVPVDLDVENGGTLTVGGDFFPTGVPSGSSMTVSGLGSILTVNGDITGLESPGSFYPVNVVDQGVFSVLGIVDGGSNPNGIHLANGILTADRIRNRPIRGYGLVMLTNPRENLDTELEIWNPMGHVSISQDLAITGHAYFLSVGAAEFRGLAVLGDEAVIEAPGNLKLVNGELRADPGLGRRTEIRGDLFVDNGVINVISGELRTEVTEGFGVVIGDGPTLQNINGTVNTERLLSIEASDAVVYSLHAASLHGTVTISGGTLTAPTGLRLGSESLFIGHGETVATIAAAPGSTIHAGGGTLILGDASSYEGFVTEGEIYIASGGGLELRSASFAALGPMTTLNFGTLSAPNGVVLGAGDNLVGSGDANCKIAAGFGSTIAATGLMFLGDSGALDGFSSNGVLTIGAHRVVINDSNQGVLGSLTTIDGGELAAPNGILLREGNNISGNGLISADVTTHGYILGDPAGLELSGYVNGQGEFGGVVSFTGTYDPGASPTIAHHQNSTFAAASILQMELGGLIPGSEHDKLIAEDLSLDGVLQVTLIDGFVPQTGDAFDVFNFDAISAETFDTIALPELTGRNAWDISSLYTDGLLSVVTMLPGDTDLDWDVDIDDHHALLAALGQTGDRWTDFNEDGRIDLSDFGLLRANFGVGSPTAPLSTDQHTTPEPTTLTLMAAGIYILTRRKQQSD